MEAIAHLTQGLAVLTTLPETPARLQQELDLQVALGPALIATQGNAAPEVEHAYARARDLCAQLGDTPQLLPGAARVDTVLSEPRGRTDGDPTRGATAPPGPAPSPTRRCACSPTISWGTSCSGGASLPRPGPTSRRPWRSMTRRQHRALAVRYGQGPRCDLPRPCWPGRCGAWAFLTQALQHSQAACTLAQEVAHPYSLAFALVCAAIVHQCRREVLAAHAQAAAAMTLATEQGFVPWVARGTVLHGWALAMQGQGEEGMAAMRQGLAAELATGATLWQPYFLGLLAEAYGAGGHPDEGLHALAEALAVMDTTEERFYAAELYRLKGALLLQQAVPDAAQAEACFQQALDRGPPAAGQIVGTAGRHEPGAPVAAAGQAAEAPTTCWPDLRLVHRGL